jgi:hypothetical protein
MAQHDQRLKRFAQEFLRELVAWRWPNWDVLIDWSRVVWLQQELVADLTTGAAHVIDLVAHLHVSAAAGGVPGAPDSAGFWLHLELEGRDPLGVFIVRMTRYHELLRTKAAPAPVLSLAVFRHLQLDGIGYLETAQTVFDDWSYRTRCAYIALPGLNGADQVNSANLVAVAWSALMRWPDAERVPNALRAIERIVNSSEPTRRKILLIEFIQAYAPLAADQRIELESLIAHNPSPEVQTMKTWFETKYDEGYEKGKDYGLEKGTVTTYRANLQQLLASRFGPLMPAVVQRLEHAALADLETLFARACTANNLAELGLISSAAE